ncbi:hypothetical protein [Paraburkholderia solisilvae]|uniref:DnaT DNA-binding domain-containing protein n=1 Tax=Paraburkholderia solisilvae TaxID=624376 RepID=A0A6J5EYN2_9BURK|nr:hypothetical protein [Paraburkholderia solisilvae]CAB3770521.1 hypothetical protein LMG29739_05808 [Paraburkholderia solisilvae]
MARIRTIKPDFWTDEKVVELSLAARLFFIGSWNFADDNGNLQRSAKKLKMQIFPADAIDCEPIIHSLIAHGLLTEYSVSGENYLHIMGFKRHQVINRPSKTVLPQPDPAVLAGTLTECSLMEGKGKELTTTTSPGRDVPGDLVAAPVARDEPEPAEADGQQPFELTAPTATKAVSKLPACPVEEIVRLYHECMPDNPRVRLISDERRRIVEKRWRQAAKMTAVPFGYGSTAEGVAAWRTYFEVCSQSLFLTNRTPPSPRHENWRADFDFLISEKGFTRALENRYHPEAAA